MEENKERDWKNNSLFAFNILPQLSLAIVRAISSFSEDRMGWPRSELGMQDRFQLIDREISPPINLTVKELMAKQFPLLSWRSIERLTFEYRNFELLFCTKPRISKSRFFGGKDKFEVLKKLFRKDQNLRR